MLRRRWLLLLLIAAVYTILNGSKPLQVDDAAYYCFAEQIAHHPTDPYGFQILWYQHLQDANEILAPPVIPYWWAGAIALFGDNPFLWKLSLFPFAVLFVFALHALFRRFTPRVELPLTCMTVFSPAFLPSLNYMLDVPAIALGLAALVAFFSACDMRDWRVAALSGLLAGFAMETKYTAFLVPVVIVLYAAVRPPSPRVATRGLPRNYLSFATFAIVIAFALFLAWECWIAQKYGRSHFLLHAGDNKRNLLHQVQVFSVPLAVLLGSVAPGIGLLGLFALTRRAGAVVVCALLMSLGFAAVAAAGSFEIDSLPIPPEWTVIPITLEQVIYFAFGLSVIGIILSVGIRLLGRPHTWLRHRTAWFILLWLGIEVAGFFVLTPFAAVRRIMGIVVVGTVVVGRLAAFTCRMPAERKVIWCIVTWQMALGLLFYGVDIRDAWAARHAAQDAAAYVRQREPEATIWFTGHWGFQFYAERSGMKCVVPDDFSRPLHQGDWLVIPHEAFEQQHIRLDPDLVEFAFGLTIEDILPLRTVRCFYGTASGAALEHHNGPRMAADVYRVKRDFVPRSP